ncbi:hypothetical protein JMJ55_30640, partial [Belnapia sp. T6]
LMNKSSYDNLSAEHQKVIDEATGRYLSLRGAKAFYDAGQTGLELARESGVELIQIDADADAEFRATMKETLDQFIDKVGEEKGV